MAPAGNKNKSIFRSPAAANRMPAGQPTGSLASCSESLALGIAGGLRLFGAQLQEVEGLGLCGRNCSGVVFFSLGDPIFLQQTAGVR